MEMVDAYREASEWAELRIAGVRADQLHDASPCRDWDVQTVVEHLIEGNAHFVAALAGSSLEGGSSADDRTTAYRAGVDSVLAALEVEGTSERLLQTSMGEVPGSVVLGIMMTEQLLHGWDVAKATGQDTALDPALVEMADRIIRPAVESGRAGSAYEPQLDVADHASPQEQLLALVGRRV